MQRQSAGIVWKMRLEIDVGGDAKEEESLIKKIKKKFMAFWKLQEVLSNFEMRFEDDK